MENHEIVIVGAGICGLATALALHRKGLNSLVLEKSDTLRASGAAIGVQMNGWRALVDQLGVGMELRTKSIPLLERRDEWLHKSRTRVTSYRDEEFRCLKRSDLIETMANNLPTDTIRFGSHIVSIEMDPIASFPILHIDNGSIIKAKVLIGCDGLNSVVGKSLGLGALKLFPLYVVRGFTSYPKGHTYGSYFLWLVGTNVIVGRLPINDNLVHWFVLWTFSLKDSEILKDPNQIRETTMDLVANFPKYVTEMVKHCDLSSLSRGHIKYRAPWDLLSGNFCKGTTTVAGDAMHVMAPFLGQGGSAGLEDAIVLSRCLSQEISARPEGGVTDQELQTRVATALSRYVRERRLRVLRLSIQTYLTGVMIASSSRIKKFASLAVLILIFGTISLSHTRYDCGRL